MQNLMKSHERTMAHSGLALLYPVSVMGQHLRSNGIPHHVTVKFFDKPGVTPEQAHDYASKEDLHRPNPNEITVSPKVFKNRFGEDVHVLALEGPGINHVSEANSHGSHLGNPVSYKFTPHISIDKELYNKVAGMKGPVKASQLGLKFGAPELRHGPRTLATYGMDKNMFGDLALLGSEKSSTSLKKGFSQNAATAMTLMSLLGSPQMAGNTADKPPIQEQAPDIDKDRMLQAISSVESSSGKDLHHEPLGGIHQGESAYGRYGLTPLVIRETISKNPDLRRHFGRATSLKGEDFARFMKKNPKLEDQIASRHYDRLHKLFGGDMGRIGHAWLNGITGTLRAQHEGMDFNNHWHVKKLRHAYDSIPKKQTQLIETNKQMAKK